MSFNKLGIHEQVAKLYGLTENGEVNKEKLYNDIKVYEEAKKREKATIDRILGNTYESNELELALLQYLKTKKLVPHTVFTAVPKSTINELIEQGKETELLNAFLGYKSALFMHLQLTKITFHLRQQV